MRKASALLRERSARIGPLLSLEQGKVLNEALGEVERVADSNDWLAGEAERIYGRTIAGRAANVTQTVQQDPIGLVAAFTPWNFPMLQLVRKIAHCCGLRHCDQRSGRDSGLLQRARARLCRRRSTVRSDQSGVWYAGGNFHVPDNTSGNP
jgi:hypothetical protein